jgi:hypothetical protein
MDKKLFLYMYPEFEPFMWFSCWSARMQMMIRFSYEL